jgi:hypothetical protein
MYYYEIVKKNSKNSGNINISIEYYNNSDCILFSIAPPFSDESFETFKKVMSAHKVSFVGIRKGYVIKYPDVKICDVYTSLEEKGYGFYGSDVCESSIKKLFQLKELKSFGKNLDIERLDKEDIFDELTRTVVLHNIDVDKIKENPSNSKFMEYMFDAKKLVSSSGDEAFRIGLYKACLLYNVEKLNKSEMEDIEELSRDVNFVILASVDINTSHEKVFPFVNIALSNRYKDLSEFNKLRCKLDASTKKYLLNEPVLDSMAA